MMLKIKVSPRSSKNEIIPLGDDSFKARLTAAPVDGAANEALIKLLSDYFQVAKINIRILKGKKSKNKILEITD